MHITRKAAATLAAAVSLAGVVVLGGGPARAEGESFSKSVQAASDGTNLDEYLGAAFLTRDSELGYQDWTFTKVAETSDGLGVYTIKGGHYGKCIADAGDGHSVTQLVCDPDDEYQKWVVDTDRERSTIASNEDPEMVLQANGADQSVTIAPADGRLHQWWMLYDK
ncbi:RICIN domain-containing protein [Kitasatospora sp. NPDC004614]|uniref:RICIN domain-containing protein n=1 Tax=unclassified Kitasatospora TaxID=2633591 RepID=UPI0036A5DFC5